MKATEDALAQLHSDLAQTYSEQLKYYRENDEPAPATLLTSVANFLKQNGIQADAGEDDGEMDELRQRTKSSLNYPFKAEEESIPH